MKILARALLFLFISISGQGQSAMPTPSLDLKDIDGKRINLTDYKSKVVLVNFWATWCAPCRQEIPDLIKLQRQYQNRGLQIIGITYPPEKLSEARRFARRYGMNYPIVLGTKETKSMFAPTETLPFTAIIDRDGNVRDVIEGIMYSDEFDQKVRPLLPGVPLRAPSAKQPFDSRQLREQAATILIGANGYQPASVRLRHGIPARLTFIRNVEQSCGTQIVIPAYGINRPLPLNTPVVVRFTPKRTGRFKFTCGMNMFRGALVVR